MDTYRRHIELLGFTAKDKVTGYEGVIDSVSFDLYGCVQVSLKPPIDKEGKMPVGYWVDVTRLDVDTTKRVIPLPNFYEGYVAEGKKGPADKPSRPA